MDEDLRFCFFSDRFTTIAGVDEGALLGKTREETGIPGVDPTTWEQHLRVLRAHRPFRNFIHPREKPSGETVWLSINGNPWFDRDGRFRGYRGTGRDITDQVATQRALQTAKDEAEAANRTKSEFLANVSHELRTPLNAIIGFSELMLVSDLALDGNPQHRGYLEDIHTSGLHLLSLINDILDLSKIEAGAEELDDDALNVGELATSVLRVVRQRAETSGLRIERSQDEGLPALRADERKLKQALLNLLVNAIKFTPAGGTVRLDIRCDATEGYVFEVSDNGIGMTSEDIPTALRQFGQIDSALNRKYEGTGLGLPLTKAMVEMHGGSLEVRSALGAGTTVTLRLPASRIVAEGRRLLDSAAG
jgi:PAS domain S-box-containing protein